MPILPSLSPTERQRIAQAAKLHVSGVKVRGRNKSRRIEYVVDGRAYPVLTAGTDRVWVELWRQVREEFHAETERLVTAQREATEQAARTTEKGSVWHPGERVAEPEVSAVSAG